MAGVGLVEFLSGVVVSTVVLPIPATSPAARASSCSAVVTGLSSQAFFLLRVLSGQ
jgi:hypothetical protein